jgi:hypothetical protein
MRALGMPLKGVVMNRTHPLTEDGEAVLDAEEVRNLLDACGIRSVSRESSDWLWRTYDEACTTARAEELRREVFEAGLEAGVACVDVPELLGDVHDLRALSDVARKLCALD